MKLVAIARVKNEIDIIEPFVRHHLRHFDKVIVLDDGSSDGTDQVLRALQQVCADLFFLRQGAVGYYQRRELFLLLKLAFEKLGAAGVAPRDADKFIEPADGNTLSQVLANQAPT